MLGWKVIPRIGIGDFGVSPHGVGIAFGVFMGAWFTARRARDRGIDDRYVWDGTLYGVAGALVGARVAYVVGHFNDFGSPIEWFQIWRGGISLVGGLIGAFIVVALYCRRQKISFFELVDIGAPGLGLGIALGRIGDLVIGDHLGKPTSGFWGWKYLGPTLISPPPCTTPGGAPVYPSTTGCITPGMVVHQTALYDMLWSFVILAILLFLSRKPRRTGFLFLSWAGLYASGRIATDFARVDKHWLGLGLTGSQITSILVLTTCLVLLFRFKGAPQARTGTLLPEGTASIETSAVQEPLPFEEPRDTVEPGAQDEHWGFEAEAAEPAPMYDEQAVEDTQPPQDPLPFDLAPESPEPLVADEQAGKTGVEKG